MIGEGIAAAETLLYAAILTAAVLGGVGTLGLLGAGFGIRAAWRRWRTGRRAAAPRSPLSACLTAERPASVPGDLRPAERRSAPHRAHDEQEAA